MHPSGSSLLIKMAVHSFPVYKMFNFISTCSKMTILMLTLVLLNIKKVVPDQMTPSLISNGHIYLVINVTKLDC